MMSLLFNMLSSFVIIFLPRSKHLNFMAAVTVHSDSEAWENKIFAVSIFPPSICHQMMGLDAMILIFLVLSFKPVFHSPFSLSSGASLVPLHFLPERRYHLHIWGCCYFSWQSFFFFLISWRLITLQYCSGFCHTLKWISHGFACVPHPDPPSHLSLLLWVFPVHQA